MDDDPLKYNKTVKGKIFDRHGGDRRRRRGHLYVTVGAHVQI